MTAPLTVGQLNPDDWNRLQEYLDQFEKAWKQVDGPGAGIELEKFLPPREDPLRAVALHELIQTELEIRCRRGQAVRLEEYLARFPELGAVSTVPASLLYEEYRVRQRYGDRPTLVQYQERFPERFPELERLVQSQPIAPTGTPPLTSTPRSPGEREEPASTSAVPEFTRLGLQDAGSGYRLIKRINRGAFGEVWRAEAPGGVEVAIKMIFGSVAEKQGQRELQALELIKRLRHPFLLPIHAYWQLEDRLLIAMELADGSLRDRLGQAVKSGASGLPVEELLQYVHEAAEALDYLHGKRVLHRDIKPENILVLEGHAKVADFDLARVVEQTRRLISASNCGTPAYTAPEVFWRGKVGDRSDQYSLAVTYAEMRLNRPLFPSRTWLQLMHDHLQRTPDLVPLLDPEQRVLRKTLAKDPNERYGSCREFVKTLERSVPRDVET